MNKLDFNKLPIIKAIDNYLKEDIVPFSMPGHKYSKSFLQEHIGEILLRGDITEVDGLDNLHSPKGIIKESEEMLTKLYKSEESFFLVNGSTSGNLIMIFSAFNEGDKIIVERNCHRSIMNGIIMRKLKPIYVDNIVDKDLKCPIAINEEHLKDIIKENHDIKGIVLTYPYYHGIGVNTEEIIDYCKKNGLIVLVDSAHGAHFGFNEKLPKSAQEFKADIVIMSAHKTLPSLTQTAYIHVNNESLLDKVKFYKGIFLSTSPSYMFMMSLEYGRYFLEQHGKEAYDKLIDYINEFKESVSDIEEINIIDSAYLKEYKNLSIDESRIVIHLKEGYSGHKLLDYLRDNRIQSEMSDERNVVLIPSPFNSKEDFQRLSEVLRKCDYSSIKAEEKGFYEVTIPKIVMAPFEAVEKTTEKIDISEAKNRVVAENIIPYPPGVPILIMGELMEEKHINLIYKYIEDGVTILGVEDKKVKVINN